MILLRIRESNLAGSVPPCGGDRDPELAIAFEMACSPKNTCGIQVSACIMGGGVLPIRLPYCTRARGLDVRCMHPSSNKSNDKNADGGTCAADIFFVMHI